MVREMFARSKVVGLAHAGAPAVRLRAVRSVRAVMKGDLKEIRAPMDTCACDMVMDIGHRAFARARVRRRVPGAGRYR